MRSISFRLLAAFCFTAAVSLAAVGGLSLWLAHGLASRRAVEDLRGNAAAVADQVQPLLALPARDAALAELAQTSAIVGSTRVRILDAQGRELADSGPWEADQLVMWAHADGPAPAGKLFTAPVPGPGVVPQVEPLPFLGAVGEPLALDEPSAAEGLGPALVLKRSHGHGSTVFTFGAGPSAGEETGAGREITAQVAVGPRMERSALGPVTVPVGPGDAPMGFVELSGGPDVPGQLVATAAPATAVAVFTALLLAAVLAVVFSRSLTAPLAELGDAAQRMGGGDLTARAPEAGTSELAALAGHFNQMADNLEHTVANLEEERDALRRFVADASHQLRTPITALATYFTLLAEDPPPAADDRAAFLADGSAQVDRLAWITHHLLDLSRLDAGLADLELELLAVDEVLERVAGAFRGRAADGAVELQVVPPPGERGLSCRADPARLEIALGNLVDNALRHTPPGGTVRLSALPSADGALVQFVVADTGAGIAADDLPRVFERFYRAADAPPGGTGLGLAVVKGIAHAHGGWVAATSTPGAGATFTLALPAPPPA